MHHAKISFPLSLLERIPNWSEKNISVTDVEVLVYLGTLASPNSAVTPELMQALKQ